MFSKLFRRGRSEKNRSKSKGTSSSTQFPPRDWADPDYVLFNSRATQTLDRNEDQRIKVSKYKHAFEYITLSRQVN